MKIVFLFLGVGSLLFGKIEEIRFISEIDGYFDPDAFYFFDLDNTIMETAQTLGSDQWFGHRVSHYLDQGKGSFQALQLALAEWTAVQHLTEMKLVENNTKKWIERLQKEARAVMGLTIRDVGLAARTVEQLKTLEIDFSKTSPCTKEKMFVGDNEVIYRNGILFTSGTNKAKAFLEFIRQIMIAPSKVIFVDDKGKYLREMEEVCLEEKIEFVGLRYAFLDDKVESFSPELAALQWECFGKLISDEEAEERLKATKCRQR